LDAPQSVAVDDAGNIYFPDTLKNALKEWTVANNTVITLVSSGLSGPQGVAVGVTGTVFFADTYNNAIKEWTAATSIVTTLVSSGLNPPAMRSRSAFNRFGKLLKSR
jgi:DNA-binding beta-propeller fold protein YncE